MGIWRLVHSRKASQALLCYVRIVQTIFCARLASLKRVVSSARLQHIRQFVDRNALYVFFFFCTKNEQKSDPEIKRERGTIFEYFSSFV